MNNNTIPICRPLAMFWLCGVVSVVLGQIGGTLTFSQDNGSILTLTGLAGGLCIIVQFYPFYRFSRVSEQLQRAFKTNLLASIASIGSLLAVTFIPVTASPSAPAGASLLFSLIALVSTIALYVSQFWLYNGLDAVRAERGYDYPSRLIRWCFYGPLICKIASILMAYVAQAPALQDYFSLPGQLFSLILLGLFIRAAHKAEKLTV